MISNRTYQRQRAFQQYHDSYSSPYSTPTPFTSSSYSLTGSYNNNNITTSNNLSGNYQNFSNVLRPISPNKQETTCDPFTNYQNTPRSFSTSPFSSPSFPNMTGYSKDRPNGLSPPTFNKENSGYEAHNRTILKQHDYYGFANSANIHSCYADSYSQNNLYNRVSCDFDGNQLHFLKQSLANCGVGDILDDYRAVQESRNPTDANTGTKNGALLERSSSGSQEFKKLEESRYNMLYGRINNNNNNNNNNYQGVFQHSTTSKSNQIEPKRWNEMSSSTNFVQSSEKNEANTISTVKNVDNHNDDEVCSCGCHIDEAEFRLQLYMAATAGADAGYFYNRLPFRPYFDLTTPLKDYIYREEHYLPNCARSTSNSNEFCCEQSKKLFRDAENDSNDRSKIGGSGTAATPLSAKGKSDASVAACNSNENNAINNITPASLAKLTADSELTDTCLVTGGQMPEKLSFETKNVVAWFRKMKRAVFSQEKFGGLTKVQLHRFLLKSVKYDLRLHVSQCMISEKADWSDPIAWSQYLLEITYDRFKLRADLQSLVMDLHKSPTNDMECRRYARLHADYQAYYNTAEGYFNIVLSNFDTSASVKIETELRSKRILVKNRVRPDVSLSEIKVALNDAIINLYPSKVSNEVFPTPPSSKPSTPASSNTSLTTVVGSSGKKVSSLEKKVSEALKLQTQKRQAVIASPSNVQFKEAAAAAVVNTAKSESTETSKQLTQGEAKAQVYGNKNHGNFNYANTGSVSELVSPYMNASIIEAKNHGTTVMAGQVNFGSTPNLATTVTYGNSVTPTTLTNNTPYGAFYKNYDKLSYNSFENRSFGRNDNVQDSPTPAAGRRFSFGKAFENVKRSDDHTSSCKTQREMSYAAVAAAAIASSSPSSSKQQSPGNNNEATVYYLDKDGYQCQTGFVSTVGAERKAGLLVTGEFKNEPSFSNLRSYSLVSRSPTSKTNKSFNSDFEGSSSEDDDFFFDKDFMAGSQPSSFSSSTSMCTANGSGTLSPRTPPPEKTWMSYTFMVSTNEMFVKLDNVPKRQHIAFRHPLKRKKGQSIITKEESQYRIKYGLCIRCGNHFDTTSSSSPGFEDSIINGNTNTKEDCGEVAKCTRHPYYYMFFNWEL